MFEILKHRGAETTEKSRLKTSVSSASLCFKNIDGMFWFLVNRLGHSKSPDISDFSRNSHQFVATKWLKSSLADPLKSPS
ncbi:MAG: hypothetical protein JWM11_7268 [Planctomycetaceae bacterium]|nr:hypothetical protein [Planctomycetaceae bacterium]